MSLLASPAQAALDAFVKFSGIDGESTHSGFTGWSDLLGYNVSVQNSGWKPSSGGSTFSATLSPMFIQKYVDTASPRLFGLALTGNRLATASVDVRRTGENPTRYALWEFEDVVISAYSTGEFSQAAVEAVAIDYRKIRYTYWPQRPDGSVGTPVVFAWDRQTNSSALTGAGSLDAFEFVGQFAAVPVPEPTTLLLVGCAVLPFVCRRQRQRQAPHIVARR